MSTHDMQRDLTEAEEAEIARLNKAVDDVVKARTEYLDRLMVEKSLAKVGDEIYDTKTGEKLGVISKIYRYHQGDYKYDTGCYCDYEYETSRNCFSNTSCDPYRFYGRYEDAKRCAERHAASFK